MRIPKAGPLGETLLEAGVRAMVAALLVNKPEGGWVESVFTFATHLFFVLLGFRLAKLFRSASLNLRYLQNNLAVGLSALVQLLGTLRL